MPRVIEYRNSCLGPIRLFRAESFLYRLGGLLILPRLQAGEALLLSPCNGIHTFGMTYPLALVFLDAQARIVGWRESVAPWRLAPAPSATRQVLEMLPDTLASGRGRLHKGAAFWRAGEPA